MNQISMIEDLLLYKQSIKFLELPENLNVFLNNPSNEVKIQVIIYESDLVNAINNLIGKNKKYRGRCLLASEKKASFEISGQFKTERAAQNFAKIRSVIDTTIKNGMNVLEALSLIAKLQSQTTN